VDLYHRATPVPHLFEWNLFNCRFTERVAFDIDGVLCEEWQGSDEEEGDEYQDFLMNACPKWLPRRSRVPLIVSARLEKHRAATCEWLKRHKIGFEQLILGPWTNVADRRQNYDAGEFKGQAYARSSCGLFIESDERQAEAIWATSGKLVLCPTAGRVFQ
jgi:uncharacterized HAD superfamily protein